MKLRNILIVIFGIILLTGAACIYLFRLWEPIVIQLSLNVFSGIAFLFIGFAEECSIKKRKLNNHLFSLPSKNVKTIS